MTKKIFASALHFSMRHPPYNNSGAHSSIRHDSPDGLLSTIKHGSGSHMRISLFKTSLAIYLTKPRPEERPLQPSHSCTRRSLRSPRCRQIYEESVEEPYNVCFGIR